MGEVWVGSGQSNMEFILQNTRDNQAEIAAANYPLIHIFHVKKLVADQPAADVEAKWEACRAGDRSRASRRWSTSSAGICTRSCTCRWG